MKKFFALILAAAVMLTAFTGCGDSQKPTGPLRICVDIDFHLSIAPDDTKGYTKYLANMTTTHGGPEDIELEIIPGEGPEREGALARIRTEIMGGGGPDVFLCSCVDTMNGLEENPLFQFPEKAMADGLFLPLDKYIETAQYMEWDKMQPALTAAGRTDEGQMIIPFSFSMPVTVYDEAEAELPPADTTFDDVVTSDDPILKSTTQELCNYDGWKTNSFPFLFTELADYETGELAFTEEELYQRVTEALALRKQSAKDLPRHFSEQFTLNTYSVHYFDPEEDPRHDIFVSTEQVMLPLYNEDGGATALICSFGAVNANTKQPENAFLVLDTLLSRIMHGSCGLFGNFCAHAMPVRTDMGKEIEVDEPGPYKQLYGIAGSDPINEIAFNAFSNAREQISYARFNTVFDKELSRLVTDLAMEELDGDEETIRERVSKTYTKMKMLLAES